MPAFLNWVDFSSSDRDRMRRAIALFEEHETRDELGLGSIRDAFADALFPGTSTIMTRLRYFLFVPWIYQELEVKKVGANVVAERARVLEVDLIRTLKDSDDTRGVIGKRSVFTLKRLPSSIYWAGLQRWRVCLFAGSQAQYHLAFDRLRRRRASMVIPEDEGIERDALHTWHAQLPSPPADWREEATFSLRRTEAAFLQGRLAAECRGTALGWLAVHGRSFSSEYVWHHPDLKDMPAEMRATIELARRFSLLMHGAALLYNLQLAELTGNEDGAHRYREAIHGWATCDESSALREFDLDALWAFTEAVQARVPTPTRRFVRDWATCLTERDPSRVADDAPTRALVAQRERSIKGARSRFSNARARDQWSGASGTGRFEYRWGIGRNLLADLHAGLHREP